MEFSRSRGLFRFIDLVVILLFRLIFLVLVSNCSFFAVAQQYQSGILQLHDQDDKEKNDHIRYFHVCCSEILLFNRTAVRQSCFIDCMNICKKFAFSKVHFYMITLVTESRAYLPKSNYYEGISLCCNKLHHQMCVYKVSKNSISQLKEIFSTIITTLKMFAIQNI